jgi:putative SOS response-associated peptidase YedK
MCGRYSLKTPLARVIDALGPLLPQFEDLPPRYNIAPTQDVPAVRLNRDGQRVLTMVRWGLVPSWAKDLAIGNRMINARAETISQKPAFRTAFERRRCLIPVDGFYEWKKVDGRKQPMYVRFRDGHVFAFAGLWERWRPGPDEKPVDSCTILTTTPNPLMADIHDRMPVIVPRVEYDRWLSREVPGSEVTGVLKPYDASDMEAYPVSTRVNSPANESPACVEPGETQHRFP